MLGRKDYRPEELEHARTAVRAQIAAYRRLADAVAACSDAEARAALQAFEPIMTRNLILTLDRYFVHRLRTVTGKDGNPLNEVELLTESLMNNDGLLRTGNVVKYRADDAVLKVAVDGRIEPSIDDFAALTDAFLDELERRFVVAG
jgi:hypothetical protein